MATDPKASQKPQDASPEGTQKKPAGLRQHEMVDRVLGAAAEFPARGYRVYGFLGKDSEAGFWRVYLSLDLDHYIRVAEADIITVRDAANTPPDQKMDEVWVKEDADLIETRALPKQMRTSFLSGPLVNRLGAAALNDVYYRRMSSRRSGFGRGMTRRMVVNPTLNCQDLAPVTIMAEGCGGPEMTSYETGCNINRPSDDCGTYGFGCPITGPQCVDTHGPSCRSEDPHCNSRPSICLCDSRHRSECC